MKYYIESIAIPFDKYDYQYAKQRFLEKYGDNLEKYNLQFITDETETRFSMSFDATIELNSLKDLNDLSTLTYNGIIVSGNTIKIYDSYNE